MIGVIEVVEKQLVVAPVAKPVAEGGPQSTVAEVVEARSASEAVPLVMVKMVNSQFGSTGVGVVVVVVAQHGFDCSGDGQDGCVVDMKHREVAESECRGVVEGDTVVVGAVVDIAVAVAVSKVDC